jgi:ABC-type branched-subunit amino acid transport system ATPase component
VSSTAGGLRVAGIRVVFGGLVAVDGVSLDAPLGRITGLIGPNGAGKTTTFNAITGLVPLATGSIQLFGQDATKWSPQVRAQHGLGRTFQRMELFDSLTVLDNVALGREAGLAGSKPWRCITSSKRESRDIARAASDALAMCGIEHLARRYPPDLSTGQRRLVELARVAAGTFKVLLLDEPSSGLDKAETVEFGRILRGLIADRALGILLVEHDMSLVMGTCDYIHVIDFGRPVFEGTPAEVANSELVRAAYLGDEDVESGIVESGAAR